MSENGNGIIFGATGFIGSQVAHKMTKKGVKLILHGKSKKKLEISKKKFLLAVIKVLVLDGSFLPQ